MMNNLCQPGADLYGPNFHAHAAAVATGHTWPYGYGQQYSFGPHPYSGAVVAEMTNLAGTLTVFLAFFFFFRSNYCYFSLIFDYST